MACNTKDSVPCELKMTLYNKEVYDGPDTNGFTIISREKIGTTHVYSWVVTDGPGPDAHNVGHMQGTSVVVANNPAVYHYSLGLVFGDKRFNDGSSTLQISGTSQINGEWSIIGGTGEFTMAKGTVKRTEISYVGPTRISELKINAFYYTPMNSTTV